MDTVQITLFGKVGTSRDAASLTDLPTKAQELLSSLLHNRQPHTCAALAHTASGEAPAALSKKYLRHCLWQLQQLQCSA